MAYMRSATSKEQMDTEIGRFVEYLLDTETTSEVSYSQTMLEKHELYHARYQSNFEKIADQKLQQWKDFYQKEKIDMANRIALNKSEEEEEESSSDNETDKSFQSQPYHKNQASQSNTLPEVHIDPVGQCKRLLQFLYHCQQDHTHFTNLYFHILDQCMRSEYEQISATALQQIALHLLDGVNDSKQYQHLIKYLPTDLSSPNISALHKPTLNIIETLLSTNKTSENIKTSMSSEKLDILCPYRACFLDVRREFRDSTCYYIDGDSLLLSIAHHVNVNLITYYGNTLHVIFIIERILLILFNQTQQCNYTLLFFDCNYQLYQQEKSILNLIRSCLIAHLSKNIDKYGSSKIRQFSSWLDEEYIKFTHEEKPHFIFYHDMSSFNINEDHLLTENTLKQLVYIYRLYGNYHQYHLQCHLYVMNKLILTNTCIKCFEIKFFGKCSRQFLQNAVSILPSFASTTRVKENEWIEFEKKICKEINQNDIRLFLYLKTILDFMDQSKEKDLFNLLSPLLLLHVALLIRLSLVDRHLPTDLPSVEFSPIFSQLIIQFQQNLAMSISSCSSSFLSWSKIVDLFDGRLFAFTLYQLNQSSKMNFDSNTIDIVNDCLSFLKHPTDEYIFHNIIQQLIQSKHIIFSSVLSQEKLVVIKKQKITKISNTFIDIYLKPILSTIDGMTFDFINPNESHLARYEGKYHWHVYKEVGDEISRVRDNDEQDRNSTKYRFRTRNQQKFYTYFTLYGNSLTNRDVQDNHLQHILPTVSTSVLTNMNTTDSKKKQTPLKKADKIREENKQQKMGKRVEEETDQIIVIENLLQEIPPDNYSKAVDIIDEGLVKFETPTTRLELLKKKFRLQRKYLQLLKKENNLTDVEKLKIDYFATMTEMAHLENIVDVFNKKKKYLEELIDDLPLDQEKMYRFQMEKINSRLPRREEGLPDNRVPDFIPDQWQVKFLDAVDKRQSIIIVAPTASGKTYASYYAMNKVLKDNHDSHGICVYIAPTKALVNQVAATIHSKFGPVFGIFTRDYRQNMSACRILVTVPQCMEILLLSPSHQRWCQQIKYAIFDEIHCMSGEIGADVWEKTMLLINCPMIGLSATVNNGEELSHWITNVEKQRSKLFKTSNPRQVCLIVHHERIADLNKYLYSNQKLHSIHPVGVMNTKQLITRGVPKDFSLSPCETLQLNDAMNCIHHKQTKEEHKSIPSLTEYFSPNWVIERNLCNNYSKLVCNKFNDLIEKKESSAINSIINTLKPTVLNYPERKPILSLIIDFILTLKEKNLLPCIIFSDDRLLCEKMAESIVKYLQKTEYKLRKTKYKIQIEELNKRLNVIEKIKPKKPSKSSNEDNCDELKVMKEETNPLLLSGYEQQLLDGILHEGTLANRQGCNQDLVDSLLKRATYDNPKLVQYMKRGVAYHHAGLNNKGRVAVEALFRNRYIQVVFSTSTLALGIHMPTKTVAFVKDSIYLDALQYRQSSGRAGRRGFDIQDTNDAINRSLIVLQCPFLIQSPMKYELIDIQTHFHFLFTLDFLYRLDLINGQGQLIGLAGLLSHLHYFEPTNILLVYLMDTRLFHLVNDPSEIMTIFAYLFTNMPWLITRHTHEDLLEFRKQEKFNSKLFLPPISKQFRQRINVYNSIVKDVYGCYIENITRYLRSKNNRQAEILPFSNISFIQNFDYDNGTFEYNLHHHYSQQTYNPSISPFAAVSGLTHEKFILNYNPIIGSWDLVYDLDLSSKIVPFVDLDCCDHTNTAYYMNSYALDFFKHGSQTLLNLENELNPGDIYNYLLDFNLVLSSIKTSLEVIIENERKQTTSDDLDFSVPLYQSISNLQSIFSSNFNRQYPDRNRL
ncbi:unnamed protein product [Adineta steineri]|uniref:Uncharacterized protein n=1 Tax=Adineta steineri TaxID=433720 RepID=A0A814MVD9_9BILA|nr:unnamed protein product [Adineta steineri]